ncbi:MAG: SDR family NAD(P)-dependent oxidoreductase [Fimbriimonadales bacterium]
MQPNFTRAIVVGASSGLGEQLVRKLAGQGCKVALVGRRTERLEKIAADLNGASLDLALPFTHDVSDTDRAAELFDEIVAKLGGLDLVIYNAGVMPQVGPTEYDITKDRQIVETNLTGAMAWLNAAAKRFERQKSGTIVGIGSVAGDRGRRGNPAYAASKAGLACFLESLRNRLGEHHVSVVTVKPGRMATEMTAELGNMAGMIDAARAADLVLRGARKFSKVVYVPGKWWLVSKVVCAIPSFMFRRMKF